MAKTAIEYEIALKESIGIKPIAEIIDSVRELTDLIPDWNNYEKDAIVEKILTQLVALLELKKAGC